MWRLFSSAQTVKELREWAHKAGWYKQHIYLSWFLKMSNVELAKHDTCYYFGIKSCIMKIWHECFFRENLGVSAKKMTAAQWDGLRSSFMRLYSDRIKELFLLFAAHTAAKGGGVSCNDTKMQWSSNMNKVRDQMSCRITQPYNIPNHTPEHTDFISKHCAAKIINPSQLQPVFNTVSALLIQDTHHPTHWTVCVVCSVIR